MKPPIRVTAGIVIDSRKVLLAKRENSGHLGGFWEFPGGKIETGETPFTCLKRELREELQITLDQDSASFFDISYYEYGMKRVFLIGLTVTRYFGDIHPTEHEEIRWIEIAGLETMALAPADVPFARRLKRYLDFAKG